MVASNDMTLASLQELIDFCNKSTDHYPGQYSAYCKDIKRQYPLIQQNYQRYASKVKREADMTLAKAADCESTFELLESNDKASSDILYLTTENFREEITRGPLVVMKSLNTAGVCLYLLNS